MTAQSADREIDVFDNFAMRTGVVGCEQSPPSFDRVAGVVAASLARSPFAHPGRWAAAIVLVSPTAQRVTSRGQFAAEMRAADLPAVAREALARRTKRGEVLCWLELDTEDGAGAAFAVLDLRRGTMVRR